MYKFEKAVVRTPADSFAEGITPGLFGKADPELAKIQHKKYIQALRQCGLEVIVLEPDNDFPDSCFVEDPVIVTDRVAILTNFHAPTRKGEVDRILPVIKDIYGSHIERIEGPGTVEGGDICQVENHFFIGLSQRTNEEGACQLAAILKKYGFTSSIISIRALPEILHLKTCMSYIGENTFILQKAILKESELAPFKKIVVPDNEGYASNCIRVNDTVILPEGFDETIKQTRAAGFNVLETPMCEFMKQDGGLSCLSLRIPKLNL